MPECGAIRPSDRVGVAGPPAVQYVFGSVDVAVDDQTAAGAAVHPHAEVLLHDASASRAYLRRSSRIHQCDPAASACSHLRDPGAYPPYGGVVVLVRHPPRKGPGPQLFHAEVLHDYPVVKIDRIVGDAVYGVLPAIHQILVGVVQPRSPSGVLRRVGYRFRISAMDLTEPFNPFHVLLAVLIDGSIGECGDVGDADIDSDGLGLVEFDVFFSAAESRVHAEYHGYVVFVMGSHVLAGYSAGLGGPVGDAGTVQADPFVLQPLPCCDLAETDLGSVNKLN